MNTRVYCCFPLRTLDCSSEYDESAYSERHEYLYLEIALEWSAAGRIAVVNPDFTPSLSNISIALIISSRRTIGWEPAVVSDIIPIALSPTMFCVSDLLTPSATAAPNSPSMASSYREPAHPTSTADTSNVLSVLICTPYYCNRTECAELGISPK